MFKVINCHRVYINFNFRVPTQALKTLFEFAIKAEYVNFFSKPINT